MNAFNGAWLSEENVASTCSQWCSGSGMVTAYVMVCAEAGVASDSSRPRTRPRGNAAMRPMLNCCVNSRQIVRAENT